MTSDPFEGLRASMSARPRPYRVAPDDEAGRLASKLAFALSVRGGGHEPGVD